MRRATLGLLLVAALLCCAGWQVAHSSEADAAAPPSADGALSPTAAAAKAKAEAKGEKFTFQAEVTRLMDILVHSLYSNKDVFLRELISNASDALDKIRFLSLTDKSVLGEGEEADLEVKVWVDKETGTLNIRDRGVGMTREELAKNLGTIAKSGTSAFLESMQKGGDVNLIGQFGVGFYSVYLVADWVEVVSKAAGDAKQWVWSSGADGSFTIAEDDAASAEPLGRGTLVKIHLKPEAKEYADEAKLKALVTKYSEFINFPIRLLTTKEVEVPEAEEEEEAGDDDKKGDDKSDSDDDDDVVDDDEEGAGKKENKEKATRKETVREWETLNGAKALWLRSPSDVTDNEYASFYAAVTKGDAGAGAPPSEPLGWVHFKAEGDIEFKSILFIPKTAPHDYYEKYYEKAAAWGLKLYVRRVFISDAVPELLPRYLSFLRGLVDSDSLPLNVNREQLQAHAELRTIRKKLVRKALDYLRKLSDDERRCAELEKGDDERPAEEDCGKFKAFWDAYGHSVKLGVIEDAGNRARLAKLLRFRSSNKSAGKGAATSLDAYVARMKEGQKQIYFATGASVADVKKSPFLESLVSKGYEVLYLTEVLDEYVAQHLTEYDGHKLADISKEDVKLTPDDEKAAADKDAEFKALTKWWKKQLGGKVTAVRLSKRLSSAPCAVVASKWGASANMERIMGSQALGDPERARMMRGQRSLEVNAAHALVEALRARVAVNEDDESARVVAGLLYDAALLESGFALDDVKGFAAKVHTVTAELLESPVEPKKDKEEEAKGEKNDGKDDDDADDADEAVSHLEL